MSFQENYINVPDAARELSISKQAVYMAIKKGRIRIKEIDGVFMMQKSDIEHYVAMKYKRVETTMLNHEKVYSVEKGYVPLRLVARILGIDPMFFYNGKTLGHFSAVSKAGSHYVFRLEDLLAYAVLKDIISENRASEIENSLRSDRKQIAV